MLIRRVELVLSGGPIGAGQGDGSGSSVRIPLARYLVGDKAGPGKAGAEFEGEGSTDGSQLNNDDGG